MIFGNPPKQLVKLAGFIDKNILKIELIALAAGLLGLLISQNQNKIGSAILYFSLISLAFAYNCLAYKKTNNNNDKFLNRLVSITHTIAIISILFVMLKWPNGERLMQMSAFASALTLILIVVWGKVLKKATIIENAQIIRSLFILGILLFLLFSPLK